MSERFGKHSRRLVVATDDSDVIALTVAGARSEAQPAQSSSES